MTGHRSHLSEPFLCHHQRSQRHRWGNASNARSLLTRNSTGTESPLWHLSSLRLRFTFRRRSEWWTTSCQMSRWRLKNPLLRLLHTHIHARAHLQSARDPLQVIILIVVRWCVNAPFSPSHLVISKAKRKFSKSVDGEEEEENLKHDGRRANRMKNETKNATRLE